MITGRFSIFRQCRPARIIENIADIDYAVDMTNAIGNLIKAQRLAKDLTQEDLARLIGQNQSDVSNVEKGKSYPRDLKAYTRVLDITNDEQIAALLDQGFENDEVVQAINRAKVLDRAARDALVTIYKQLVVAKTGMIGRSHTR
jgi:transcriptional regulator with XRE-family HTH domain